MPTFGDKLRYERESRNTRIQEVSERTHIGLRYLEALENNDFHALPGPRGFAKLYIRAYAELLGFDPRALIDAFEEERRKRSRTDDDRPPPEPPRVKRIHYVPPPLKSARPERPTPTVVEPAATAEPEIAATETVRAERLPTEPPAFEPARNRKGQAIIAASLVTIFLLIVSAIALRPKSRSPSSGGDAADPVVTPFETETVTPKPPAIEPLETQPPAPTATAAADPGRLNVTESGVGSGVVDRRLVGRGTRFAEGSTVFFFTRVVGAEPGQKLRHVWLREGRVVQNMELPLGSANWRTYSNKTLWGQGSWAVEARDADDQVLARADFSCEAR